MPTFLPAQLAQWTGGRWTAEPAVPLAAFSFDTRRMRRGDVFVALKTAQRDGHDFLGDARAAGAAAALVAAARPEVDLPQLVVPDPLGALQAIAREHRRNFRGPVVAVTGSAGKTSTKDLLALLLGGEAGGVLATEGNLNNHIGVPLTLTRLDPARHRFAVVEAGISAPGEMAPLAAMIAPDLTIVTLVAAAHTHELGGLDGVAREKAVLSASTRPGGVAIFPRSVAEHAAFALPGVTTQVVDRIEAGAAAGNSTFSVLQHGDETVVRTGAGEGIEYFLRRVTDGMAQNAALAILAALRLGITPADIQVRLRQWQPGKLRGEIRREAGRLLYLDCYNANPASMADALAAFVAVAPVAEPRLYVIGCMEELGPEAADLHRALGRHLTLRPADRLFITGTNGAAVAAGVLDQGDFSDQIRIVSSLEPVAAAVAAWRGAVFVKGSRRYQLEKILEAPPASPLPC
jgi:UDP-N-acetylmuramoyl-tripeptide--D-alanyl-D-alanine ligase